MEWLLTFIICTAASVCSVSTSLHPSEDDCAQTLHSIGASLTPNRNTRVIVSCTPHKPT